MGAEVEKYSKKSIASKFKEENFMKKKSLKNEKKS